MHTTTSSTCHTISRASIRTRHQRAAQFMPFAALTGYNQVIEQTAKNAETAIAQAEAQGDTDFGA